MMGVLVSHFEYYWVWEYRNEVGEAGHPYLRHDLPTLAQAQRDEGTWK